MPTKLFPSTESLLLDWAENLQTRTAASPATYGLTSIQCTAFGTTVTNYAAALAACTPGVRSKATVLAKNDARDAMKTSARFLANIVDGQASVTDAQRAQLGLNVRAMPVPIPPPGSQPGVEIVKVTGRNVTLRFKSTETIGKRGRPAGVAGIQVYSFTGAEAPLNPALWRFEGTTAKTLMDVQFPDDVVPGTQVWFTAAWMSPTLMTGPAATPVTTHTQFGNTLVALVQQPKGRRAA